MVINSVMLNKHCSFIASFDWFRDRCDLSASINENKELLKTKISEAKILGERANQSRYEPCLSFIRSTSVIAYLRAETQ